ncbi:cytochrome b/b6 domain-containing protein [Zoogloea sp.]|uniref:cytochrome b/b6 domain-containing protein n=1 Tax=Zoogloea sp. TaxID=49181 RepID=UPI002608D825|nr:cytochrome b/b6 domain-containing protein [Zoogloea sp.]MDD3353914.1 cytochrome b/b6 domain-containing protein [Zoogloea sp.]
MRKILVWDWPVRIGHALMAGGFIIAWLTQESERLSLIHAMAGSAVLATAVLRLAWGVIGSPTARFSAFVRGPRAVGAYLLSLLQPAPQHYTGHNPAGGWAILLLLGLGILTAASGWAVYNDVGGHSLEELHEGLASTMLSVVVIHVGGVILSSWLHRENLLAAMVHGRKLGAPEEEIPSAHRLAGLLLLVLACLASVWLSR